MRYTSGLNIIYEDNHLIAINKSNSDLVQGDKTGDEALDEKIKKYLKKKYSKPGNVFLGVMHRIDRPVSGVVLFARTSKALIRMNEMLKKRNVQKHYLAIVENKPDVKEGTLKNYIVRNRKINKSFSHIKPVPESKEAILDYKLIGRSGKYYLLYIDLKTGRHHQIRSQLAKINCPVKGDLKYGFASSNPDGGISLHSYEILFKHPVKKEMISIIAQPPKDTSWNLFAEDIKNNYD